MLLNAIFALSSRHRSNVRGIGDLGSREYAARCIQLLIPVLDNVLASWAEDIIVTVVLLRLYEELSPGKHLPCRTCHEEQCPMYMTSTNHNISQKMTDSRI